MSDETKRAVFIDEAAVAPSSDPTGSIRYIDARTGEERIRRADGSDVPTGRRIAPILYAEDGRPRLRMPDGRNVAATLGAARDENESNGPGILDGSPESRSDGA